MEDYRRAKYILQTLADGKDLTKERHEFKGIVMSQLYKMIIQNSKTNTGYQYVAIKEPWVHTNPADYYEVNGEPGIMISLCHLAQENDGRMPSRKLCYTLERLLEEGWFTLADLEELV